MKKVAVVGAGIAGIITAHLLQKKYRVSLFEKNNYVGGHTNTVEITEGQDSGLAVDTGFIVLNDKTYPTLHKFLAELNVPVRYADMSFGYCCERSGLQYAGTNLNGFFAQRKNLLSPSFIKFILEIGRFSKSALSDLEAGKLAGLSVEEYLAQKKFSKDFIEHYVIPVGAAIWSSSCRGIFEFPAETYIRFFKNHGLLSFKDRPRWQTVVGGSHTYVKAFLKAFTGEIRTEKRVEKIRRLENRAELIFSDASKESFDLVVLATHADEALKLLADPSADEGGILGAWTYHKNYTLLHTDTAVLPTNKRAWASWNYRRTVNDNDDQTAVFVSYYMNHLQGFSAKNRYSVTLNCPFEIPKSKIIKEINYTHPAYTLSSLDSQKQLPKLQGQRNTYFAGSYFGYGFHEDAIKSGVQVAKNLGVEF